MTFGILISGNHARITGPLSRQRMEAYAYTIVAKVEGDAESRRALVKESLQTLLAERLHRESQPRQVLVLVLGEDGVKMKESAPETQTGVRYRSGDVTGAKLNMAYLAVFLSNQMKRPIVDKTELRGLLRFYAALDFRRIARRSGEFRDARSARSFDFHGGAGAARLEAGVPENRYGRSGDRPCREAC